MDNEIGVDIMVVYDLEFCVSVKVVRTWRHSQSMCDVYLVSKSSNIL